MSKKSEFSGLLVLPVVCHLQYRPMGSKFFLFILHGSKKIVKNFQAKIQSGTWPKYSLKNTKNSKKSKILRFSLQTTIVNSRLNSLENEGICRSHISGSFEFSNFRIFLNFLYFSKCILTMFQTVFWPENFLQFSLTQVG